MAGALRLRQVKHTHGALHQPPFSQHRIPDQLQRELVIAGNARERMRMLAHHPGLKWKSGFHHYLDARSEAKRGNPARPVAHRTDIGIGEENGMQLFSTAFTHNGEIPRQFTCEGANISPELSWKNAPAQTRCFALLVHDPDAPISGGFTHWVVYNIPAHVSGIAANLQPQERISEVAVQGKNSTGKLGYTGPCPPSGKHRYFFRLYALDSDLPLSPGASEKEVRAAMRGHILDETELMGAYAKSSGKAA